jgi:hypothetical protein
MPEPFLKISLETVQLMIITTHWSAEITPKTLETEQSGIWFSATLRSYIENIGQHHRYNTLFTQQHSTSE